MARLSNFEMETTALTAKHEVVPLTGTRSRGPYLKDYGNPDFSPSISIEEANEKSAK